MQRRINRRPRHRIRKHKRKIPSPPPGTATALATPAAAAPSPTAAAHRPSPITQGCRSFLACNSAALSSPNTATGSPPRTPARRAPSAIHAGSSLASKRHHTLELRQQRLDRTLDLVEQRILSLVQGRSRRRTRSTQRQPNPLLHLAVDPLNTVPSSNSRTLLTSRCRLAPASSPSPAPATAAASPPPRSADCPWELPRASARTQTPSPLPPTQTCSTPPP